MYTTQSGTGDIFTLIMDVKSCSFKRAINYCIDHTNLKVSNLTVTLPFNGFFKNIKKGASREKVVNTTYEEEDLPSNKLISKRFIDDNISAQTQEKWGVRYDGLTNSILIPIRNENGDLVGCKARVNESDCPTSKRWWAFLKYSKTHFVYGLYENYRDIINNHRLYVFESEKSVLQCDSFGVNNAVAIGGNSLSSEQVRLIKSMLCKEIVVAFDEGLDEEQVIYEVNKLKMNNIAICNKVGYIWDDDNSILEKGSKNSPSDLGLREFNKLSKEKIKWM